MCGWALVNELKAMAGRSCQQKRGLCVSARPGCCACAHDATGAANTGYRGEIPRATLAAPHSSSLLKTQPWTQCLALLTAQLELFPVPQCHSHFIGNGIRKERLQLSKCHRHWDRRIACWELLSQNRLTFWRQFGQAVWAGLCLQVCFWKNVASPWLKATVAQFRERETNILLI